MSNQLLAAVPQEDRQRLSEALAPVQLRLGETLYTPGHPLDYVYFPVNAIVSLLYLTETGAESEIAIIGNDGMVGVGLFLGGDTMPGSARVQLAGKAYRLDRKILQAEFHRNGRMQDVLLSYSQALLTQMAHTTICNRHHDIDQQLCRRPLLALDRLPDANGHVAMTHELIAQMLGVRREGVSAAASKLQKAGAIRYSRGHIEVLDRSLLESLSCECYAVVRRETARLIALRERFSTPANDSSS